MEEEKLSEQMRRMVRGMRALYAANEAARDPKTGLTPMDEARRKATPSDMAEYIRHRVADKADSGRS